MKKSDKLFEDARYFSYLGPLASSKFIREGHNRYSPAAREKIQAAKQALREAKKEAREERRQAWLKEHPVIAAKRAKYESIADRRAAIQAARLDPESRQQELKAKRSERLAKRQEKLQERIERVQSRLEKIRGTTSGQGSV